MVDYITAAGKGRISLAGTVIEFLHRAREDRAFDKDVLTLLVHEPRIFGGNSITNLFRSGGVTCKEIDTDVLSHAGGKSKDLEDLGAIELKVLQRPSTLRRDWRGR